MKVTVIDILGLKQINIELLVLKSFKWNWRYIYIFQEVVPGILTQD